MINRSLQLYVLSIVSFFRQLRYDLARELVIAVCSSILVLLFYYIFNDFLNVELHKVSLKMKESFGSALSYFLALVISILCGQKIRKEILNPNSFGYCFLRIGEDPKVCRNYWILRVPTIVFIFFAPTWYISNSSFNQWTIAKSSIIFSLMALVSLSIGLSSFFTKTRGTQGKIFSPLLSSNKSNAIITIITWRIKQMIYRNRLSQICFAIGGMFTLVHLFYPIAHSPISFFIAFMAGLLCAFSLIFQFSKDLECSWIEKNLGISHEFYISALILISIISCLIIGGSNFLAFYVSAQIRGMPSFDWSFSLLFISAVPSFLVPFLIFQIDGRRPGIQLISLVLCSLFICTAIYASLLSIILLPIIAYYGIESQKGRFYRA